MKHSLASILLGLCWALQASLATAQDVHGTHTSGPSHPPHHWSYAGATGTTHWAELESDFLTCKSGHQQSPIDIVGVAKTHLPSIGFNYLPAKAEVVNNGHSIQVNLLSGNNQIQLGNDNFKLLQFHFHTPSEEKINGKSYPMVAHMVHRNAEGKLAVVAVLFKLGRENRALRKMFSALPEKEDEKVELVEDFNPADLLPGNKAYYSFMGSLTTPPCTEGVRWQVLEEPVEISKAQFRKFQRLYPMNARPIQPKYHRRVEEGS